MAATCSKGRGHVHVADGAGRAVAEWLPAFPGFDREQRLPCWKFGCTFLRTHQLSSFKPVNGEQGFSTYTSLPGLARPMAISACHDWAWR